MALRNNRPRTDAADEFMKGIREAQERVLAKEKAELAQAKAELAQAKGERAQAKAGLAQEQAGLAKEKAELATIEQLEPLSTQESAQFREASQLANRCTEQ